jgi:metallo-beta-lactamase family protein
METQTGVLTLGFYGGAQSVTGANFVLADESTMLMVDCGTHQGHGVDRPFPYNPKDVEALFITHAHIDHIGRIPELLQSGFLGKIFMTPPTRDLSELSLLDGAHLARMEAEKHGGEPRYTEEDVRRAMEHVVALPYEEKVTVGAFEVFFLPAGHILGSSVVHIAHTPSKKVVVFSGDLGNTPDSLLEDAPDIFDAEYLVLETVYGNRRHIPHDARSKLFKKKLLKAIGRGGTILIPAFSIARTQLLLYELSHMMESGDVPHIPVFLDSPLAIKVTEVYKKYPEYLNDDAQKEAQQKGDIFGFQNLAKTLSREDSKTIAYEKDPKIIIAGAGMSHGGRIEEHEARYLERDTTTVLIPGYQALGTFGRKLLDGDKNLSIHGKDIALRAHIEAVDGYSAHGDQERLLDFVLPSAERGALKKVFLTMGELGASMHMAQKIHDFTGVQTTIPEEGEVYNL